MDRLCQPARLISSGGAVRFVEGVDPESLVSASEKFFADAAGINTSNQIDGFILTGGGGGASWIVQYSIAALNGPNNGIGARSVYTGLAGVAFGIAYGPGELNTLITKLIDDIGDAYPTAQIHTVRTAAGGRDGAWLVGVLFQKVGEADPYLRTTDDAAGPYQNQTVDLLSIAIPTDEPSHPPGHAYYRFAFALNTNRPAGTDNWRIKLIGSVSNTIWWDTDMDFTGPDAWDPVSGFIVLPSMAPPGENVVLRTIVGVDPVSFRNIIFERMRVPFPDEAG